MYFYCRRCNGEFESNTNFLALDENYFDWGNIHIYGETNHDWLCHPCAVAGGLTNVIFDEFHSNRELLYPYWQLHDEEFLAKCIDDVVNERIRYVWIKAQVFARIMRAKFLESNPLGNLNDLKHFILAYIDKQLTSKQAELP